MMDPLILNVISIASLVVGVIALIQAACYNYSAKKTNKRTEQMQNHMDQMQKYMENMINLQSPKYVHFSWSKGNAWNR